MQNIIKNSEKIVLHYDKLADPLSLQTGFPKSGPAYKRKVGISVMFCGKIGVFYLQNQTFKHVATGYIGMLVMISRKRHGNMWRR